MGGKQDMGEPEKKYALQPPINKVPDRLSPEGMKTFRDAAQKIMGACRHCGRMKAKNANDAADGMCARDWAPRDKEATTDCEKYATDPKYVEMCDDYQLGKKLCAAGSHDFYEDGEQNCKRCGKRRAEDVAIARLLEKAEKLNWPTAPYDPCRDECQYNLGYCRENGCERKMRA